MLEYNHCIYYHTWSFFGQTSVSFILFFWVTLYSHSSHPILNIFAGQPEMNDEQLKSQAHVPNAT